MQLHTSLLRFQYGRSFLHAADVRVKIGCLILWQALIWYTELSGILSLLVIVSMLYAVCRISFFRACVATRIIILMALFSVVVPLVLLLRNEGVAGWQGMAHLIDDGGRLFNVRYALRLVTTALLSQLFVSTTPISRWVDGVEWILLPWRRARSALGLVTMVALNYITIIQQYHHRVAYGMRARLSVRRRLTYGMCLRYCLSLVMICARFATLTTVAVQARKFSYNRSRPTFSVAITPTLTLLTITFAIAIGIVFIL